MGTEEGCPSAPQANPRRVHKKTAGTFECLPLKLVGAEDVSDFMSSFGRVAYAAPGPLRSPTRLDRGNTSDHP